MERVMYEISVNDLILSVIANAIGKYWFVFVAYMVFNILDWITGSLKAIKNKKLSSYLGVNGLIKKLGYWIVIGIAFSFSTMFVVIGKKILNINISIMYSLGWFTFLMLLINEVISILENLVALGIKVPKLLLHSLKVTEDILDDASEKILDKDKSSRKQESSKET